MVSVHGLTSVIIDTGELDILLFNSLTVLLNLFIAGIRPAESINRFTGTKVSTEKNKFSLILIFKDVGGLLVLYIYIYI